MNQKSLVAPAAADCNQPDGHMQRQPMPKFGGGPAIEAAALQHESKHASRDTPLYQHVRHGPAGVSLPNSSSTRLLHMAAATRHHQQDLCTAAPAAISGDATCWQQCYCS
jgi:hypothetical protein